MNKDVQTLFNYAMKPFFDESKHGGHIDDETYKKHYGSIFIIHNAIRKLENELKDFELLKLKVNGKSTN